MRRQLFALAVGLAGCATAHKDSIQGRPDASHPVVDSNNRIIDAPADSQMIDAPMQPNVQTLSQTTANNDTQVGIACGNAIEGWTARNSYYRVFPLSNYGINGTFHVTGIDFVISAATNSPHLKIGVGTYMGTTGGQTINSAGISLKQSTTFTPPDTATAMPQHIAIATDVTGNLIIEIDQTTSGSSSNPLLFYIGANEAGESMPGYISSADCSLTTPTSMDAEAQQQTKPTDADMVLTVTGSS
jgi:hypothetical protein